MRLILRKIHKVLGIHGHGPWTQKVFKGSPWWIKSLRTTGLNHAFKEIEIDFSSHKILTILLHSWSLDIRSCHLIDFLKKSWITFFQMLHILLSMYLFHFFHFWMHNMQLSPKPVDSYFCMYLYNLEGDIKSDFLTYCIYLALSFFLFLVDT